MDETLDRASSRVRIWLAALLAAVMVVAAACAPDDEPVEEEEAPPEPDAQAIYIDQEITFTGDWDEWAAAFDAVGIHLDEAEDGVYEDLNLDAVWGWDEEHFYIGVLVRESEHSNPHTNPGDVWNGSALEWGVEVAGNMTKSHYALTDDGDLNWQTWEGLDVGEDSVYNVTRHEDDGITIYELATPWAAYEAEVGAGDLVVSSISVNTGSDGAYQDRINFTPGIQGPTDTGQWATFELLAPDGNGDEDEE